jgi:histidinol dehydrogenase
MGVVPARVAGVDEVVVASPPGPDGRPSALVMAACAVAGADRLFALGGTAAVGALAYGTASVPRVDRIVGPGNAYVMEAKLQVSTVTGIDSPAGPSELLVLADASADPETVAVELIAQAEHDPDAAVVLVSTDERVALETARALDRLVPETPRREIVEAALDGAGAILVAESMDRAAAFATDYAPEHLLILTERPRDTLAMVRCAGTVFLGPRSSVAYGDYATGANHVLPTGGLARSYSGLSTEDFVRWTTWQEVGDPAAADLAAVAAPLADAEGLPGHAAAARRAAGAGEVTAGRSPSGTGSTTGTRSADGASAGAPGAAEGTRGSAAGRAVSPRRPYREMDRYDPKRPPLALDLSANTNLWGPCPSALETLKGLTDDDEAAAAPLDDRTRWPDTPSGRAASASLTGYPTVYATPLKEAIAAAWDVAPSQVVTGCGSDDIIDSAIRAYCEPGATVAFPAPTFPMADAFARMNDTRPRPVPFGPDGDLDDDAIAALAAADLVYLCRPNNPTGAMVPRTTVETLLERARGVVLIDEAYAEFAGESLVQPALESGRGVVLRTFSKAYGLAALRVGYALGPEPLIEVIELSRGPYKVNGLAERAATAAIRGGGAWVRDIVDRTVESRTRLAGELRSRGFRVADSAANFVYAGVRAGAGGTLKAGLAERGIGIRVFEGAGAPPGEDAIRVTVGPWPEMARFLAGLDEVLAVDFATSSAAPEESSWS